MGFDRNDIIFEMTTPLIHQLLSCHYMQQERAYELQSSQGEQSDGIAEMIRAMDKRKKPKFDF